MTAPSQPTLKLLLIADSDSQLLACEALCSAPTTLNVHWTINVIPRDGNPGRCCNAWPSGPACATKSLARLLRDRRLQHFDAIGVFPDGQQAQRHPPRPATGASGVPCCSVVSTAWCWTTSSKG